jgi:hypothetical protein
MYSNPCRTESQFLQETGILVAHERFGTANTLTPKKGSKAVLRETGSR